MFEVMLGLQVYLSSLWSICLIEKNKSNSYHNKKLQFARCKFSQKSIQIENINIRGMQKEY